MAARNSTALTSQLAVDAMAPELTAAGSVIPLALEEPDPHREDSDVAAGQRGEGVGDLQCDAPPVGKLADDGAQQRPGLGRLRELGEDKGQRDPSPAGALDGVQGAASIGQDPDDGPDADQRAEAEQQVGPADPLLLRELGYFDAGPSGDRGPQLGQQIFVVMKGSHGDRVQRGQLQVHQGVGGRYWRPGPGRLPPRCAQRRPARPSRPAPRPGRGQAGRPEPRRTPTGNPGCRCADRSR